MHGLMASCGPTRTLLHANGVVGTSDQNPPAPHLLEMAVDAQVVISRHEHLLVDGAMGIMADGAPVAHGFVFKDERTPLRGMTPEAVFVLRQQGRAAFDRGAFMRVMAVAAIYAVLRDLMMLRQREFASYIRMAFKTVLRCWPRMDNRLPLRSRKHAQGPWLVVDGNWFVPAGLGVQTARTVTGFATHVDRIRSLGLKARMGGGLKVAVNLVVTLGALLGADEVRPRNVWQHHNRLVQSVT